MAERGRLPKQPIAPMAESAYWRLDPDQQAFVDTWIETGRVREALSAAGRSPTSLMTAWNWFNKYPDITRAIKERCDFLHQQMPEHIGTEGEVLHKLFYLMRESDDEEIQLKATVALLKHFNPKQGPTFNFNLKELLDKSEELEKQKAKVHR